MKKMITITILIALVVTFNRTYAQKILNHDYPRIAVLHWKGGNINWTSKFDLILSGDLADSNLYKAIRTAAPNSYILSSLDWNMGEPFAIWGNAESLPAAWRIRRSDGTYIPYVDYFADPTEYCGTVNGKKFQDSLASWLLKYTPYTVFDGNSSNGTWNFPWNSGKDVDLDRNGINDYSEHGTSWIRAKWYAGQNQIRNNLRNGYLAKFGNRNAKLVFSWVYDDTMCINTSNGLGWEDMYRNSPKNTVTGLNFFNQWDTIGPAPRLNLMKLEIGYDASHAPANPKNYFRMIRFGLCTALMTDAYYMNSDGYNHNWTSYYDEFDVKLGYPKGRSQVMSNGCYARIFDNGIVILNPTNTSKTVTSSDLISLTGYAGPYYRFSGNQDPVWNNGSIFTSVTLISTSASGGSQNIGDGIILVKTQTTVISDIIVDNATSGTSPGSTKATLTGFTWDNSAEVTDNPTWYTASEHENSTIDCYNSYYAAAGNGSAKAIYKPTINVSGKYNVYEWHGWRGRNSSSYTEASNVPCIIAHANGVTNLTIDQTKNYGSWNLLGTFDFTVDGKDSVVITNNANGYVIADAFKFEYVGENNSAPATPELRSPTNGALNNTNPPLLSWYTAMGAVSYKLEVASDSLFANVVYSDSSITTLYRQTSPLSSNMKYFWRVQSINQWGISAWSNVWSFTTMIPAPSIPTLSLPANGSINISTSITLSWNASTGAAMYRLQIATDSLFQAKIVDDSTLTQTSKQVTSLSNNTKYYWRVNAKNNGGISEYSPAWNFITIVGFPSVPTLLQPIDGANNLQTTLTLSWNASLYASTYRLQISTDSLFNTIKLDDSTITGTSKQADLFLTNTKYYWRVNAKNMVGTSSYSKVRTFTTIADTPAAPELRSPSNGELNISNPPLLSWNTAMGAVSYKLEVATDSLFANVVYSDSSITTLSRRTSILASSMKYFWRVQSINQLGISGWSNVWSFTTVVSAPSTPVLSSPANGSINMQTSVALSWNASTGAAMYRLQIATDSLFQAKIVDDSTLTQTSKQVTSLSNNTKYYWRVNAKNNGGTSEYSPAWNFITIVGFPSVPTLLQPINGANNLPTALTLSWNASLYASTYRLQISTDSFFNTIKLDDSTITGTSKQADSFLTNTKYYWRVNAKNMVGTSSYSRVRTFTTVTGIQLTMNRKSIDYGKVIVGTNKKDSVTLINSGSQPISISKIISTRSEYTVSPSVLYLFPGNRQNVYITFYASKRDTINGLVLQICDSLGLIDTIKVTGRGVAPPKNVRHRKSLYITSASVGTANIDSFVVYNSGDLNLSILNIQSTEPSFSISPTSAIIAPSDSQYFYLTTRSNDSQSKRGYLIFTDNSKETPDSMFVELTIKKNEQPIGILPSSYSLEQNYPNPFNPTTSIGYQLPVDGYVKLIIYSIIGQEVKTLVDEIQQAGPHSRSWDAANNEGALMPSGVYFYRIHISGIDNRIPFVQVRKMQLLK